MNAGVLRIRYRAQPWVELRIAQAFAAAELPDAVVTCAHPRGLCVERRPLASTPDSAFWAFVARVLATQGFVLETPTMYRAAQRAYVRPERVAVAQQEGASTWRVFPCVREYGAWVPYVDLPLPRLFASAEQATAWCDALELTWRDAEVTHANAS